MQNQIDRIEAWVRSRQTVHAKKAIVSYLRGEQYSLPSMIQACEWYRRLGLYREGLALLRRDTRGKLNLWSARFLMLVGASSYALLLAKKANARTAEEYRSLGEIYLENEEHRLALVEFRRMRELSERPFPYSIRVGLIEMADSHASLEQWSPAHALIEEVRTASTEPLLHGIADQAQAEYFAKQGDFQKARSLLERAESRFNPRDLSADYGVFLKWKAYVAAKLGKRAEAVRCFKSAFQSLSHSHLRPEAWLHLLRLKALVGELSPHDLWRLRHYPQIPPSFVQDLPPGKPSRKSRATPRFVISACHEEWQEGGRLRYGLPIELRLLAWLRVTEDWGLPYSRCFTILWPDEPHSWLSLESRLDQLIRRLRTHYRLKIFSRNRTCFLDPSEYFKIQVNATASVALLTQESGTDFSIQELMKHYEVSKTRAHQILRDWLSRGWVTPLRKGPKTRYLRQGQCQDQ